MSKSQNSKIVLRTMLRESRASISEKNKKKFSKKLVIQFNKLSLETPKYIALYLSTPEEISTYPLIEHLLMKGHKVYVPVLHPHLKRSMWFQEYNTDTKTCLNKYNMFEPIFNRKDILAPWELDLVLLPLVGFDKQGNRLGMGGGFYDNTFRYIKNHNIAKFIGLAYACQKVESCPHEPWDLSLDTVITPEKHYRFNPLPLGL
jgi:5-formyltetrahydrofolate cyclo-ligase